MAPRAVSWPRDEATEIQSDTLLDEGCAAILRGDRDIVWLTTGPGLLTRAFANWLAHEPERLGEHLAEVAIPSIGQMREIAAIHCNVAYKRTGRAWLSGAFSRNHAAL